MIIISHNFMLCNRILQFLSAKRKNNLQKSEKFSDIYIGKGRIFYQPDNIFIIQILGKSNDIRNINSLLFKPL